MQNTQNINHDDRLERIEDTLHQMSLKLNTAELELQSLKNDTKSVIEAFRAASGAFLALDWLARVAKPIVILVTVVGTFFMYLKGIK